MDNLTENTYKAIIFYENGLLTESELLDLIESGIIDTEMLEEGFIDSLKSGARKAGHVVKRTMQVAAVSGLMAGGAHVYDQHQKGAELYKNIEKADSALSKHISDFNSKNKTIFGNSSELNNHLTKEIDKHNSTINLYKNNDEYKKAENNINDNKELIKKYNSTQKVLQSHDKETEEKLKNMRKSYEYLRKDDNAIGRTARNIINSSDTTKKVANWFGVNTENPRDKVLNDAEKKEKEYLETRQKTKKGLEDILSGHKKEMDEKGVTQSMQLKKSFDDEIDKEEKEKGKLTKLKTETDNLNNNAKMARDKYFNSKPGMVHSIVSSMKDGIFGKK